MSSVRLTQSLRERILKNVSNKFQKPIEMVTETLAADFGDRVYAFFYRKELKHMEALPKEFFNLRNRMTVKLENRKGNQTLAYIDLTSEKRIPEFHNSWRNTPVVINASLFDEYKLMEDEKDAVVAEEKAITSLIVKGFRNATTLKKLLEMLPEIEMFIPNDALSIHYQKIEPKKRIKRETENITASDDQKFAMAKVKMANL